MKRAKTKSAAPAQAGETTLTRYLLPPGFSYEPPRPVRTPSGQVHWTGGSCGATDEVPLWEDLEGERL